MILHVMVGLLAVALGATLLQDGLRPGGWLSELGNWFSRTFGIGQAQATTLTPAQPQVTQAPQRPASQQERTQQIVQQRWRELTESAQGQASMRLSPLASEQAFVIRTPQDGIVGFQLAVPGAALPRNRQGRPAPVAVVAPDHAVVLSVGQSQDFPGNTVVLGHADGSQTVLAMVENVRVRPGDRASPNGRDPQGNRAESTIGFIRPDGRAAQRGGEEAAHLFVRQLDRNGQLMPLTVAGHGPLGNTQRVSLAQSVHAAGLAPSTSPAPQDVMPQRLPDARQPQTSLPGLY